MSARILLFDIETSPSLGYVWGKYDQNVIEFDQDWYILSVAWKWLEDADVYVRGLPDYSLYKKAPENDRDLVTDLWKLIDEADIVIAQNGDGFDIKKSNARFITHGLPPPSTYKTVDTLKLARKHFKFDSNKLGDLGKYLGLGTKLTTTGWSLWKGCLDGDPDAWKRMKEYNVQDVVLLEQIYLKLRPWATGHPNLNLYTATEGCPNCGGNHVQRRGFNYAKVQVRQRWHCQDCHSWYSGKVIKK